MEIVIDEEFRDLIAPLSDDERAGLEASILSEGCRDSLVVWNETLIDGYHRHEICTRHSLGYSTVSREFPDRDRAREWVIRNQFSRRNLTPFVRAELALKLEPLIRVRAKARQSAAGGDRGNKHTGGKPAVPQNSAGALSPIETRVELAKTAGISHDTIEKAKAIAKAADDATKAKLRSGELSINAVFTTLKRCEKECKRVARRRANQRTVQQSPTIEAAVAAAKFATIVIDPPWDWSDEGDVDQLGRAKPQYATMTIEQLLALPVGDRADEDCHIYLWITNRSLPKGFELLAKWGFRYVTCLTWCKPSYGMGNYFRGQTEHILFGVKGSQPLLRKDVGTCFQAPRGPLGHSSKPESFYTLVESCSPGPYLEIFARSQRDNWTSWGGEL